MMSIVVHETSRIILLLTAYKLGGKLGALQIDPSTDKVLSSQEKPEGDRNWINAGYSICEPEVFGYIPENDGMAIFERIPLGVQLAMVRCMLIVIRDLGNLWIRFAIIRS